MENIKLEIPGEKHTRQCIDCSFYSEDLNKFIKNKGSKYGRRNLCISCGVKRTEAHPKSKDWKTDYQTKKRYGVDVLTYKYRMSLRTACEICESKENLCYDHDHKTMEFRGVLCRSCNSALGHLGDSIDSINKVVQYLTKEKQ